VLLREYFPKGTDITGDFRIRIAYRMKIR